MACVVILMENYVNYPGLMILSDIEISFKVVDMLVKTLVLLKKSTDITILLGSRIEFAQVLDVPGIGYLVAISLLQNKDIVTDSCNTLVDMLQKIF